MTKLKEECGVWYFYAEEASVLIHGLHSLT